MPALHERVAGLCRGCGGEVYIGEFAFRLAGQLFCQDCVRTGRERLGETAEDVCPCRASSEKEP